MAVQMSALDVDVYKQETNSNQSQSVGCACFSETSRKKVLEFKSVPIRLNRTAPHQRSLSDYTELNNKAHRALLKRL